ncbi:hypothetical protein TGME49_255360 [Toxoplasma gondii ME49]|uniref:DUF4168 domain-containing protein n=4 Tax=Toxoplasma gondii TaxID=5811 RepID=B6KAN0_TOXGV|nr:hypothetical protein TGME49_255360 [Toxoplasma gondii ME49]EPT29149.1 hypothetical protein TGME49_255360 [Toxoplasma gondii ME49]ESS35492.1 hypothetical protein TGVEG_255360 [Toxoplasma gondii VEG]KYF45841.1 hypothetical protein TGARI_255360 [Toxoplasma gondii ARI]CEL74654.1 TPA: hypothetical protein BN1205_079000 [Toxoplasma gondii VEG]|eukprot:XP_002364864.1 hypothetical protein TGME49_255360 [Toxoplasma gondii ME49]
MRNAVASTLMLLAAVGAPAAAQMPVSPPAMQAAPVPASAAVANQAVNPSNPLKNAAAERLESLTKGLADAIQANPFFQLTGLSMQIRELALTNPDAIKGAGVYVVNAPKPSAEMQKMTQLFSNQGIEDILQGVDSPAVKMQRKEEEDAKLDYDKLMEPENQSDLQKALPPQERLRYDQQRIGQIKNQLSVYKKNVEKAKKLIRKKAEAREQ